MPDRLSYETFSKCVKEKCRVYHDAGSLEMELVECRKLSAPGRVGSREPFSLLFRGPKSPVLPQKVYPFELERMGTLEIFVVPIGPDEEGMQYEAIFT